MDKGTPKMTKEQRVIEREKRLKEKQEKEQKRLEEKERRLQAKLEKENERERKLQEKLEREQENKRKLEEKENERLRKLQEKLEKEQEKERILQEKEHEKRLLEEKKLKACEKFKQFFSPKKVELKSSLKSEESNSLFKPFVLKHGMQLAPVHKVNWSPEQRERFLILFANQNLCDLYLTDLKKRSVKKSILVPMINDNVGNDIEIVYGGNEVEDEDVCLVPIENDVSKKGKVRGKLLQFHENRRPAFFGTFRKQSTKLSGRTPIVCDKDLFDYDLDSEAEWCDEDDEPGEQLNGSDDDEVEPADDYEVDNDVFVPHGYLSEDEEVNADDNEKITTEKLKELEVEFENEIKSKTQKLKPTLCGLFWQNGDPNCSQDIPKTLLKNRIMFDVNLIKLIPPLNFVNKD